MEEHNVVDFMRGLELKLRNVESNRIVNTIRGHFSEELGFRPALRLFESPPKKRRCRNRDRVTIIMGDEDVRVIWKGTEIQTNFQISADAA